jgi:hypothetical protein
MGAAGIFTCYLVEAARHVWFAASRRSSGFAVAVPSAGVDLSAARVLLPPSCACSRVRDGTAAGRVGVRGAGRRRARTALAPLRYLPLLFCSRGHLRRARVAVLRVTTGIADFSVERARRAGCFHMRMAC